MDPELERYAAEIGDINVAALRKGGEVLLDQVQHDLGVAYRHTDRVRRGVFTLTPQIIREIEQSLERGRQRIGNAGT